MNKIIATFTIILLILVIPSVSAQQVNIGENANQKSVTVTINKAGDVHVVHIVNSANTPKQVELIDGEIQNLIITNEEGEKKAVTTIGNNDAVVIFPSGSDSIIEYDLKNVLLLKNNLWTLDFLYLETTNFVIPEELDLIFVNSKPVYLDNQKGISCHGCQMIIEYAFNEPKNIIDVNWENKEFFVEITTFANIENFEFNQPTKEIKFNVNESNQFITTIIPLELLWGPYAVFLDDEKILFQDYKNNGTHVWINMRPDTAGEISIIGTTVVPEFPIIAPLAIGFLIIMMAPLIKKINLR
jgi:hypothetical protein